MTEKDKEIADRLVQVIEKEFASAEIETLIPMLGNYYAAFCAKCVLVSLKSQGPEIDQKDINIKAAIMGNLIEDNIKTHVQLLIKNEEPNDDTNRWGPSEN